MKYKIGDRVEYKDFIGTSTGVILEVKEKTQGYVIQYDENKNCYMNCGEKEVIRKLDKGTI